MLCFVCFFFKRLYPWGLEKNNVGRDILLRGSSLRIEEKEVACEQALHLGESRVSCSAKTFLARTILPAALSRSLTARFLESLLHGRLTKKIRNGSRVHIFI